MSDLAASIPSTKNKRNNRKKKDSDDGTVSSKQSQKSAFEAAFDSFPANETSGDPFFGSSFSSFPAQATNTNTAAFDDSLFNQQSNTDAFADFGNSPGFFEAPAVPDETVWETNPHESTTIPQSAPVLQWDIQFKLSIRNKQILTEPIHNPQNGCILFIHQHSDKSYWIAQIHPETFHQVAAFPILDSTLRSKVKLKYNASILNIHKVWRIAASTTGNIAVILDAKAMESATTMRLIVGWKETGQLHHVLTPPSGGDFVYNIHTFTISNTSIFLAGGSPKGSCVFVSRPAIRESWSANFLTGSGQVTSMSIHDNLMVIGLTDQSITIWRYKPLANSKRWLLPLCRLSVTEDVLSGQHISPLPGVEPTTSEATTKAPDIGFANNFAWFQPEPSALLLLAVALETAVVVFHVELPVRKTEHGFQAMPEPTPTTVVTSTPTLQPIAAIRYGAATTFSQCAWISMGMEPCLSVLMHDAERNAKMMLYALKIPSPSLKSNPSLLECQELCATSIPPDVDHQPKGMLFFESSFMTYTEANRLYSVEFGDVPMRRLGFPVVTVPPGLDSFGEPLQMDSLEDLDGVLHVFASAICDREKQIDDAEMFVWSKPMRRWWLCRTVAGDSKDTFVVEEENKGSFEGEIAGGAATEVLCELRHDDLVDMVPSRIVRCKGAPVCCVLFRSSVGKEASSQNIRKLAIVSYANDKSKIDVLKGKDLEFFPVDDGASGNIVTGLVLSTDGSSLTFFQWDSVNGLQRFASYRPILGVEEEEFVACERIFLHTEGSSRFSLSVQGVRSKDGRQCFLTSDPCERNELSSSQWSKVLPNIVRGRLIWLEENEIFFTALGLQGDGLGYRYFSLVTSTRVLTLSSSLALVSEHKCRLRHNCISPIGSFAACFVNGNAVEYLVALEGEDDVQCGNIAALKPSHGASFLLFLRPDRIITYLSVRGLSGNFGLNPDQIQMPVAAVKPALLLEPMVANAVCAGGSLEQANPFVRTVVEKFGRMKAALAHSDSEGIGITGAGLSSKPLSLLRQKGFHDAANWLLSGSIKFERDCNTKILPPWLPMTLKVGESSDADMLFHILTSGDLYLREYSKTGDRSLATTLPRRSDPSSYLAADFAESMLESGRVRETMDMYDFAGGGAVDSRIFQLTMSSSGSKNVSGTLSMLSGADSTFENTTPRVPSVFAAVVSSLQAANPRRPGMEKNDIDRWMKRIAPSCQRMQLSRRSRPLLLDASIVDGVAKQVTPTHDTSWVTPCNESKHVWNEGPRKAKDKLLALDRIEDWLGTSRPLVLGHEGANAAADRGAKTLADILNEANDDSFGADQDDLESVKDDGWVDGVGEGRSDDANLSAYFRMSDGSDSEHEWKTEGLLDITPHQNRALLVGDPEGFSIQPSTSSVDEGEAGKVKSLFDLVFESSGGGKESCLTIPANRGSSIDVGIMHDSTRQSRKKCSLEFWYYLPSVEAATEDIILARRTMGPNGNMLTDICRASNTKSVLWDLVLLANGEIEFRTCGGTSLNSSEANSGQSTLNNTDDEDEEDKIYLATPGRWNHICLVLNATGKEVYESNVSLFMKGKIVAEGVASFVPSWLASTDFESDKSVNEVMQKSHICFCLNHCAGMRLTELRLWACDRSADDIQRFLYEYLNAAEQKKKFKVKIANKNKKGATLGKGLGLAAPKANGATSRPQISLAPTTKTPGLSLRPPPKLLAGAPALPGQTSQADKLVDSFDQALSNDPDDRIEMDDEEEEEPTGTLWDTAMPLSEQVRPSAAAAIIRGPPATRHYGGNRGGLPDFSGVDRFGVGGIAICGSDKTVVFRDNEDPPTLTYPIGASGAIVSDQMDDEGSEFLCCFMAKEGRMVVFELSTRTVVVELQMTTKLNFWRYLPPEAAENTLCYILVTPVGGFHWMPLEEVPRPHQVWKRGPELQGKKVVSYEEGGSNGLDGPDILSKAGLVLVTRSSAASSLEGWVLPISGDSKAQQVPGNLFGACFCQPVLDEDGPFLPMLATVTYSDNAPWVSLFLLTEPSQGSLSISSRVTTQLIDDEDVRDADFEPPPMAMGTFPEALCVSLSNILVMIIRRKGLVVAYELDDTELNLIAQESVDHFVVDAVMRYSAEVGGAEIVMLLGDDTNPKDGRIVSFCFRSAT